jgi:2-dehydro-3-deoxyphosphooctonate aldolase (KDO 8-P synthase)
MNPTLAQSRQISVGKVPIGGTAPLALIAGPCVIESRDHLLFMAEKLVAITQRLGLPLIFKASFDKANRTSVHSFRGPGIEEGLKLLALVKEQFGVPILTDVHTEEQAPLIAEVCDILQIPAFLCRQTDFVAAVGRVGRAVNVKKGQFLAPGDVRNIATKLKEVGCEDVLMTERGVSFGYGTLVTDFRALPMMQEATNLPVCFDATHSVQQPGGLGTATGGQRQYVPHLARAACAVGTHALFIETHDRPDEAKSDGPNMVPLAELEALLRDCMAIDRVTRGL